jgi:circadian clock protein KaiC
MQRTVVTAPARRMETGIGGFDEITDGGLPRGGLTVVFGGAGTGKTVFGMQLVARGSLNGRGPGLVVAFEESPEKIVENTAAFVWGGAALTAKGVHVLDARLAQSIEQGGEFDLVALLAIVGAKAAEVGAQCVVFDGLDVLLGYLGNEALVRREMFRLRDWVHASGLTVIVTAKSAGDEKSATNDYDFLQYIADCVVLLHHRISQGMALRFVRVAKYRGVAHSANEFPFITSRAGIEVASTTRLEVTHPASHERVSTGVERLDWMMSGGYYRGSSVLITGAPGTAKTSLSSAFAAAACKRGERTVYVSFDESPDQLVRNVASIGLRLDEHIASGVLCMHALRARAEGPEAHVARIRQLLVDHGAHNLVVDPLSALQHRDCDADAEAAALDLIDGVKNAGITIVSTSLLGNVLPLNEQTPLNISTIADTWMHVSYVSQGGERNRALTIVKSRGTRHSNQVRELILSDSGVTLADVYAAGGEVLMGTLRWEKENEARRARISLAESHRVARAEGELGARRDQRAARGADASGRHSGGRADAAQGLCNCRPCAPCQRCRGPTEPSARRSRGPSSPRYRAREAAVKTTGEPPTSDDVRYESFCSSRVMVPTRRLPSRTCAGCWRSAPQRTSKSRSSMSSWTLNEACPRVCSSLPCSFV